MKFTVTYETANGMRQDRVEAWDVKFEHGILVLVNSSQMPICAYKNWIKITNG